MQGWKMKTCYFKLIVIFAIMTPVLAQKLGGIGGAKLIVGGHYLPLPLVALPLVSVHPRFRIVSLLRSCMFESFYQIKMKNSVVI